MIGHSPYYPDDVYRLPGEEYVRCSNCDRSYMADAFTDRDCPRDSTHGVCPHCCYCQTCGEDVDEMVDECEGCGELIPVGSHFCSDTCREFVEGEE